MSEPIRMKAAVDGTAAELGKNFDPKASESELYEFWNQSGCFEGSDESVPGQESFSIVIPPPNVTGVLHMGHALTNTIQDILVRWKRMRGFNTLWLPGTDHAGIATQTQVEKAIAKEGKGPTGRPLTRHDLGREKFLERTWAWKEQHAGEISNQLKRLGSSLDWSRERFTMDDGLSKAVREVFVRLYREGLIYRGERIINWDVSAQSALSDLEVEPTDRKGKLWHIRYEIVSDTADGEKVIGTVVIATTRPETMLGDTAIAVHPEDERYTAFQGKKARIPLVGRTIPVLADAYVDRAFGTGALKITPAHDFNDYDLGIKHGLPFLIVMGKDGKITDEGGAYAGLKFAEAREKIVADLEVSGALVKIEDYALRVGVSQRTGTVVEPMLSKQWFVKIEPLAKPAIAAVEDGSIEFRPKTWEKTYFEWMHNIRDWCISRQLWWGHRIPAWHCAKCPEITVSETDPTKCSACGSALTSAQQDEDVLDTWFSSALWPFSTMGWPEQTKLLKTFYPTSILETGFDIIFFWVARMIMMGLHFTGKAPFERVYLHAMVRDEKGEKMSKSKGNVINPLELIDQHGADPLRFTLAAMAGQGRDIKLSVDRVEGYRAFANKLWNAVKFFHLQLTGMPGETPPPAFVMPKEGLREWLVAHWDELLPTHHWILNRLEATVARVHRSFEAFELNEAANALYEFGWLELCDWGIEFSKIHFRSEDAKRRHEALVVMRYALEELLKALHPIMPFVTETLWQSLPGTVAANTPTRIRDGKPPIHTLMLQTFSTESVFPEATDSQATVAKLRAVIEAIRNFRGENQLSPKKEFVVKVAGNAAHATFFAQFDADLRALSRASAFDIVPMGTAPSETEATIPLPTSVMGGDVSLRIDLRGLVNFEEERKRLLKEIEKCEGDISHSRAKLEKPSFVEKAPPALLQKERDTMAAGERKLEELRGAIARIAQLAGSTP